MIDNAIQTIATCVLAAASQVQPGDWPAPVQPYVDLAERARQYEQLASPWRVVVDETFDGPGRSWAPAADAGFDVLQLAQADGRGVLQAAVHDKRAGWLAVGEPVAGDMQIELVARSMSDRPCDLSVFAGRIGHGPGFQFGAWHNRRNLLWISRSPRESITESAPASPDDHDAARTFHAVDLANQPLIVPQQWHTIRMTLRSGWVTAEVDGRVLARRRLGWAYDDQRPLQPFVYVFATAAEIDRVTVRRLDASADAADRAWEQAFGDRTRQMVTQQTMELAELLGHPDWAVRDAAQRLLGDLGALGAPAVEQFLRTGDLEQRHRCRQLLDRM